MFKPLLILILLATIVCFIIPQAQSIKPVTEKSDLTGIKRDSAYTTDYAFIGDSVFTGLKKTIAFYVKKYTDPACKKLVYAKRDIREAIEKPFLLGNIRKNKKTSVFLLLSFCDYENGKSYYFTDTSLPRLSADVYCTHPENIFLVGDIDEDGVSEIGEYYSSCASHYKSLRVWTLKNKQWHRVGISTFDLYHMDTEKPHSSYVKKIRKGEFAMYEKTDIPIDKTKNMVGYWIKYKMK